MLSVSILTSLGFMLIGYDNGLMGGLVGAPAFNETFDHPSANMIGTIVAIFESKLFGTVKAILRRAYEITQLAASWVPWPLPS